MAGWQESEATLLSVAGEDGPPADPLVVLCNLVCAVRIAHAHLNVRQTEIAQMALRDALREINAWVISRRDYRADSLREHVGVQH